MCVLGFGYALQTWLAVVVSLAEPPKQKYTVVKTESITVEVSDCSQK